MLLNSYLNLTTLKVSMISLQENSNPAVALSPLIPKAYASLRMPAI